MEAFARPRALMTGAEMTGDPLGVLPVLYHLLWRGLLRVELAVALHEASLVSLPGA
jgi:hypothetical protein